VRRNSGYGSRACANQENHRKKTASCCSRLLFHRRPENKHRYLVIWAMSSGNGLQRRPDERRLSGWAAAAPSASFELGGQQTKPKRALSAYNLFFQQERRNILEERPTRKEGKPRRSHGKIGFADLGRFALSCLLVAFGLVNGNIHGLVRRVPNPLPFLNR